MAGEWLRGFSRQAQPQSGPFSGSVKNLLLQVARRRKISLFPILIEICYLCARGNKLLLRALASGDLNLLNMLHHPFSSSSRTRTVAWLGSPRESPLLN